MKKSIIKDVLTVNVFSIINKFLMFLFILIISRNLGSKTLGQYTTANTILIFILILMAFGSDMLLKRTVSRNREDAPKYFLNTFIIKLFIYIIICLLFYLFRNYLPFDKTTNYLAMIFIFMSIFKSILTQISVIYQAHERFFLDSFNIFMISLTILFVSWFIVNKNQGIVSIVYGIFIINIIALIINILIINKKFFKVNSKKYISKKLMKKIFIMASPFFVANVLGIIYHRIDILMLAQMKGEEIVGYYSAGYKLYEALLFIPVSVGTVFFPKLVKLIRDNCIDKAMEYSSSILYFLTFVVMPICIGTTIFSEEIIKILFGKAFIATALSLQILIWGLIIHSFNNILGRIIYAIDKEKFFIKISLASMIINVILNLILIPKYSLYGASIATIVSFVVSFCLHYYCVSNNVEIKKIFSTEQLEKLFAITILFLLSCLIIKHLYLNIFLSISILFFIYGGLLIIFNVINKKILLHYLY
jgi:O-antigen/teichoic acid export membrane protein